MPSAYPAPIIDVSYLNNPMAAAGVEYNYSHYGTPWAPQQNMMGGFGGSSSGYGGLGGPAVSGGAGGGSNDLESLANRINAINQSAQQQANQGRIPGGAGLEQQSSNMIQSQLAGQIPSDVMTQLNQQAAERGVAMGSPGSPNVNAATLRALGLTSMQQQQLGQQNLTAAEGRNPTAPLFDPSTMLITPYQQAQLDLQNKALQVQWANVLARNAGGGPGGIYFQSGTNPPPPAGWPLYTSNTPTTSAPQTGLTLNDILGISGSNYANYGSSPFYNDAYYYTGMTPSDYNFYYGG